jgi:hypothetical protein
MTRTNWNKIAANQFQSLSGDIQNDWGDLYNLTVKRG